MNKLLNKILGVVIDIVFYPIVFICNLGHGRPDRPFQVIRVEGDNLTVYDQLLPNLLPCEIERGDVIEQEVEWSTDKKCEECGDRMFWQTSWDKWVCRSWIYMEGGC